MDDEPPEDFIEPTQGDQMSYDDFLALLESFSNAEWTVVRGAIRRLRSHKSPFSIICEEMMQIDIGGDDYRGAEALNLLKKDARRIIRALNGNPGYDPETRKDLLRVLGLLGKKPKKADA